MADNLARVPDQQTLDNSYIDSVICSKSRGMVHIRAHFLPLGKHKREFWSLIRCNYPDEMLRVCGDYQPLRAEVARRSKSELSPDLYYNLATYYGNSDKLHSLRGVWVDVDTVPHRTLDVDIARRYAGIILGACDTYGLPAPWIVYTGRGLQVVWPFFDAVPCDDQHQDNAARLGYTLQRLAEWWGDLFRGLGLPLEADTQATNLGRLLRVPGSYNGLTMPPTRAHVLAEGVPCNWSAFSALGSAPQEAPGYADDLPVIQILPTTALAHTVAQSRLDRLGAWAAGRGYDIEGYRNVYLHLCACMLRDDPDMDTRLAAINARLVAPLGVSELRRIANSARVHCYHYSNSRIAALLDMDATEAEAWGSSCQPGYVLGGVRRTAYQLAQATGVDTRRQNRKRDEGRAERKADKASKYAQIPGLLAQGLSLSAIAKRLGLSKSTVDRHRGGE